MVVTDGAEPVAATRAVLAAIEALGAPTLVALLAATLLLELSAWSRMREVVRTGIAAATLLVALGLFGLTLRG